MAHHGSTPRSVLDAPHPSFTYRAVPAGATRHERRHGILMPSELSAVEQTTYLRFVRGTRNVPVVIAEPRRGRKVQRRRAVAS